ncbi:MAG: hypothetical protein AB7G28_13950 [Pirellulales bacterium]
MSPLERQAKLARQLAAIRQEIREAETFLLCKVLRVEVRQQIASELELRMHTRERIETMLLRAR